MSAARLRKEVDALVSLGGDGTVLDSVRLLAGADKPLLGVNLGSLGFMTAVPADDMEKALEALVRGRCHLSQRAMMQCTVLRGKRRLARLLALNDIVAGWGSAARIVAMDVAVHGESVGLFTCDGIAVSTPTGSTGHSLSAGGPILLPDARVFCLNVLCPHTLSNRPLVLPDSSHIAIRLARVPGTLLLSADGQPRCTLKEGDELDIARSAHSVRFVLMPDYSYFHLLRRKLHWRSSMMEGAPRDGTTIG
jgi:NAD+ kinase